MPERNKGVCIGKMPHSCGSSDGLQLYEHSDQTVDGFCFVCRKYEADPLKDKPEGWKPTAPVKRTPEDIKKEIKDIRSYQTLDLPDRMLKKEHLAHFGIKIGVCCTDGVTPDSHFYPYVKGSTLQGFKVRMIEDKRMWSVGAIGDADLFGWYKAKRSGARRLYITEGEIDAVSVYQVLKDKQRGTDFEDQPLAVVSLPHGSGSATKSIGRQLSEIQRLFKEVVLCFDMDAAGELAVQDVMKLIPDAVVAVLPEKDPNDCITKGRSKALANAILFNAKKPKNSRLIRGSTLIDAGRKEAQYGVSWPWDGLTKLTRGIRTKETYYIGAGVKMGSV